MKTKTVFKIEREFDDDNFEGPTYFGSEYLTYEAAEKALARYFTAVANAAAVLKSSYAETFRIIELVPREVSVHHVSATGEVQP